MGLGMLGWGWECSRIWTIVGIWVLPKRRVDGRPLSYSYPDAVGFFANFLYSHHVESMRVAPRLRACMYSCEEETFPCQALGMGTTPP